MRRLDEQEFEEFVRTHRTEFVRTATTLAAGDKHLAEDVVQNALVKVYLAGPAHRTNLKAYVRRAIVNGFIDHRRRSFVRRETVFGELPEIASRADAGDADEPGLVGALGALPVGMRAAVVLRHVEGLSVEETADLLGCSTGNVKSQTARGLERLRLLLHDTASNDSVSGDTASGDTISSTAKDASCTTS